MQGAIQYSSLLTSHVVVFTAMYAIYENAMRLGVLLGVLHVKTLDQLAPDPRDPETATVVDLSTLDGLLFACISVGLLNSCWNLRSCGICSCRLYFHKPNGYHIPNELVVHILTDMQ